MKIIKLILLVLLITPIVVCADNSGASFLKIAPGAKPVGMGGAYNALSGDINCLYYNPAGLGSITQNQIGAMHTEWISDIRYNFAAGVFNLKDGALGISATVLTMGEMEGRDANRQVSDDFVAYDLAIQCSYAKSLNKNLIGGSFKFIRQKIADETANGIAVDVGLQRKLTSSLNMGVTIRNLGPKMKFIKNSYNLPLSLGIGTGFTIGGLTLAFDTNYEIVDKNMKVAFGTEYMPFRFLSFRGGYFLNALKNAMQSGNDDLFEQKNGLGGGVGIEVLNYNIDYAVVPYENLGTTQRLSLSAKF